MEFDISKTVQEIVMQAKETQEDFIIETIYPYCEDILQIKINKEELKQILLKGAQNPIAERYKPIVLQEHDAEPRTLRAILDTATDEIYICRLTRQGAKLLGMTIVERNDDEELENIEIYNMAIQALKQQSCEDVGELSDGYHTFNQLYYQRAVLFACIVKQNKNKAWKSFKHSDGKYCFDSNGEWFIVGVDTPQGSYTYHYAKEYWNMFDCPELECGKEWDGHTEEDVTRLLSLEQQQKTSWVPCSERLPKNCMYCLITVEITPYGCSSNYEVHTAWFDGRNFIDKTDIDHIVAKRGVIAWMPLPQPYKAESE